MFTSSPHDPRKYDTKGELKKALESSNPKQIVRVIRNTENAMQMSLRGPERADNSLIFQRTMEIVAEAFLEIIYEEVKNELLREDKQD